MDAAQPQPAVEQRFVLLMNPSAGAGRAKDLLPRVEAALRAAGAAYELIVTRDLEHGMAEAERAATEGSIPVVMSGDGLIGKIGGGLSGGDVPLGVIPGGRGNDLARVLGIPSEPEEAVALLLAGETRRIDVGEANGVRFLCIASCGFDSDANRIANETKWIRGPLVYAYAALRALAQWKPARFTLTEDGEVRSFRGYSVAVANSRAYGGGMFIAPEAELDDGLLDVITTADVSKLSFLRGLPDIFKGTHVDRPEVSSSRAAVVEIEADRPFAVYADGELITDLPCTIKLRASSLSVIAPASGP
ncbi:MAG: diacylglycerol kinase family protein [Solirubrobacterales bacterium]